MVNRIFNRRFSYIFSFICTFFEKSADKQYTEKMCYFCGLKSTKTEWNARNTDIYIK